MAFVASSFVDYHEVVAHGHGRSAQYVDDPVRAPVDFIWFDYGTLEFGLQPFQLGVSVENVRPSLVWELAPACRQKR